MNDTTTTAPPPDHTPAPPAVALPPLIRRVPRVPVPVYAKRPCGRLLYEITDERLRDLAKSAIGFSSLTPRKLEALQELGVQFVEVDAPEE